MKYTISTSDEDEVEALIYGVDLKLAVKNFQTWIDTFLCHEELSESQYSVGLEIRTMFMEKLRIHGISHLVEEIECE